MNAPIKPPDEFAEAKRFLLALSPNGPWALTAIRPFSGVGERSTETLFCTDIDQVVAFIAEHNGKHNLHFTANTTKPVSGKPRERDIARLTYVQVDIDKDVDGVRLTAVTKQEVVTRLQSTKFCKGESIPGPPTFIIDSGNGLQALWRIAGGLAPTEENLHSVKEMNAHIIKVLHGDKGTHNPVQLMRLPGTTNIPSAGKRKAGLVECQAALLVATEKAYAPSSFARESVLYISEGAQVIGSGESIESLDALKQWPISDSTKRTIVEGRDSEWQGKVEDDTDSAWQFKGIMGMLEHAVPDAIVKGIITDARWGISRSTLKAGRNRTVDDYADRQIQRAHDKIRAARLAEFPADGIEEFYGDKAVPNESTPAAPAAPAAPATPAEKLRAKFSAKRFILSGETSRIPPRDIFMPGGYIRGFVCGTVGHGGGGKSIHTMVEVAALLTGLPLLEVKAKRPYRWLLINLEDPILEIRRRLGAICKHYNIPYTDEGLFVIPGRGRPFCLVRYDKEYRGYSATELVEELIEFLIANKIDGMTIDPFLACHQVEENSNDGMEVVMQTLNYIATKANIAIHIIHHPPKSGGANATTLTMRGGGAILAKLRQSRSLFTMTEKEAREYGIEEARCFYYYWVTRSDKHNLGIPETKLDWYELKSVFLSNGMKLEIDGGVWTPEDGIGVPIKYTPHIASVSDLEPEIIAAVLKKLGTKKWCQHASAKLNWVGTPVAMGCKDSVFLDDADGRRIIGWKIMWLIDHGYLREIEERVKGKDRKFYIGVENPEKAEKAV